MIPRGPFEVPAEPRSSSVEQELYVPPRSSKSLGSQVHFDPQQIYHSLVRHTPHRTTFPHDLRFGAPVEWFQGSFDRSQERVPVPSRAFAELKAHPANKNKGTTGNEQDRLALETHRSAEVPNTLGSARDAEQLFQLTCTKDPTSIACLLHRVRGVTEADYASILSNCVR